MLDVPVTLLLNSGIKCDQWSETGNPTNHEYISIQPGEQKSFKLERAATAKDYNWVGAFRVDEVDFQLDLKYSITNGNAAVRRRLLSAYTSCYSSVGYGGVWETDVQDAASLKGVSISDGSLAKPIAVLARDIDERKTINCSELGMVLVFSYATNSPASLSEDVAPTPPPSSHGLVAPLVALSSLFLGLFL